MDAELYETNEYVSKHDIIILQALHSEIPPHSWRVFRALHCAAASFALLLNTAMLLIIYGCGSKLAPMAQLITNLCFSNIVAAWAVLTMYFPPTSCQEEIQTALMLTSFIASSLTLMAYAACYYAHVFYTLEFNTMLTRRKVWLLLVGIWAVALALAHLHFLVTLAHHHSNTIVCYQVFENTDIALLICLALAAVMIATVGAVVVRILLHLKPDCCRCCAQRQSTAEHTPGAVMVMPRHSTRDVTTLALIASLHSITWTPLLFVALEHLQVHNNRDDGYAVAMLMLTFMLLVLLNSVASPLVCALRLDSIVLTFQRLHLKLRAWLPGACSRVSERHERVTSAAPLNPIESVC